MGSPPDKAHQEYLAKLGALYRPGVRIALRNPLVVYKWNVSLPDEGIFKSITRRAARVGYLGTSDSPVRIRATSHMPMAAPVEFYVPDPEGNTYVSVTRQGHLDALNRMYDAWTERGASVSRSQYPSLLHRVAYRSPNQKTMTHHGEVVAWLRIRPAVSGRRIAIVTALLKEAVLSRYQRMHGEPPAILHGHGFTCTGYDLARYLALPDVGYSHSKGVIHGLALWLPPGSEASLCQKARDAAFAIDKLVGRSIKVDVDPWAGDKRPWAVNPRRWTGPAKKWVAAFPVIHERRGAATLAEATRWCHHAGLPNPIAFRSGRTPLIPGAVDLAPTEVNRLGRAALPYSHAEFRFAEPIRGPVVIGAGRQRGLGLCVPINE